MRTVLNFNPVWVFSKQATEVPASLPTDWEQVNLPHCWNAVDGQDGGNDYHRGTCYYVKSFEKSALPQADCYYLELQGANSSADVYLNGKHLAHHHQGGDDGKQGVGLDVSKELFQNTLLSENNSKFI